MTISVQSLQVISKGTPQMLPAPLRPLGHPTCPYPPAGQHKASEEGGNSKSDFVVKQQNNIQCFNDKICSECYHFGFQLQFLL